MRGQLDPQSSMFQYFSPESRVPADHPLRRVRKLADRALAAISADPNALYSSVGRPSIPPERLLKGQLLIARYSIRSDRQFCEQLDYNILFRWFLDLDLESAGLDQANFSPLRERLVATDDTHPGNAAAAFARRRSPPTRAITCGSSWPIFASIGFVRTLRASMDVKRLSWMPAPLAPMAIESASASENGSRKSSAGSRRSGECARPDSPARRRLRRRPAFLARRTTC